MLTTAGSVFGTASNVFGAAVGNVTGHINAQSTASTYKATTDDANFLNNEKARLALSKAGPAYAAATASEVARNASNP